MLTRKEAEESKDWVRERERRSDCEPENKLLCEVASKIKPEGVTHQASFAVHLYRHPISNDMVFLSQATGFENVPEIIASESVKECAKVLMRLYGRKPPKTRGSNDE